MKKLLVILLSVLLTVSFSLSVGCKEAEEPALTPAEKLRTKTLEQEELEQQEPTKEELEQLEKEWWLEQQEPTKEELEQLEKGWELEKLEEEIK